MDLEFKRVFLGKNNYKFRIIAKVGGKTVGEGHFFERDDEPGVIGERIDISKEFRRKGLGTLILQEGDRLVREEFPDMLRRFSDINGYSYRKYTDSIPDHKIVDFDDKGLLFKP